MRKSIYFLIAAVSASILLAGTASLFTASRPLLVLLYASGVAIAALLYKSKPPFEKKFTILAWLICAAILPLLYVSIVYLIGWSVLDYPLKNISLSFATTTPLIFISAFFEETGWRGFLFKTLEKQSWVKMNLIIGLCWAIWHYPSIFSGNYNTASPLIVGVIIFTLNVILLSFIIAWFRQKTGGILAPTLLHTFHNFAYHAWTTNNDISTLSESGIVLSFVLLTCIIAIKAWKKPQDKIGRSVKGSMESIMPRHTF